MSLPRSHRLLKSYLAHLQLSLVGPEWHIHCLIQSCRMSEIGAALLALVGPSAKDSSAEVALGQQWTHSTSFRDLYRVVIEAIYDMCLLRTLHRPGVRENAQYLRLQAS